MLRLLLFGTFLLAVCVMDDAFAADRDFGKFPLFFVENRGQIDCEEVAYTLHGADTTLFFTPAGITFSLPQAGATRNTRWIVELSFVGADPQVEPLGK